MEVLLEGRDGVLAFAAAVNLRPAHVPSGEVGPGPPALVFVLDAHGGAGRRATRAVDAPARLNARLLVRRQYAVGGVQRDAFPEARVQVEDSSSLFLESGIAGEQPAAMVPGSNGVLAQPPPEGGFADRRHEPALNRLPLDLGDAQPREWKAKLSGQLAGEGFNGGDHAGGKSGRGAPRGGGPRGPRGSPRERRFAAFRTRC